MHRSSIRIALASALVTLGAYSASAAPCEGPGSAPPGAQCDLPDYGGAGGAFFRDKCPAGHYLGGLSGRSGAHVDQIGALCYPLGGEITATKLPSHGGTGGGSMAASCLGQVKAVNVNVTADNGLRKFVRSIELICNPGAAERTTACAGYFGESGLSCKPARGDQRFYAGCPSGMIAVGVIGRAGSYVDSFGLTCGSPAPPPQERTTQAGASRIRIESPTIDGRYVDNCRSWATDCGRGGAEAVCAARGYPLVRSFKVFDRYVGETYVIGSNRVCSGELCRGLEFVECEKLGVPSGNVGDVGPVGTGPVVVRTPSQQNPAPAPSPEPTKPADPGPNAGRCPAGGSATVDIPEPNLTKLNVRDAPNGRIVTTIAEGSAVTIEGGCGAGDWCKLKAPVEGCVMAKYLAPDAAGFARKRVKR